MIPNNEQCRICEQEIRERLLELVAWRIKCVCDGEPSVEKCYVDVADGADILESLRQRNGEVKKE